MIFKLNDDERKAYRLLLAGDMKSDAGRELDEDTPVAVLSRLRHLGLVRGSPPIACRPSIAFGRLRLALDETEEELEALYDAHARTFLAATPVEPVTDSVVQADIYRSILDSARQEILMFITGPYEIMTGEDVLDTTDYRLARIVVHEDVCDEACAMRHFEGMAERGARIRVAPDLSYKMLIGDRQLGLIRETTDCDGALVLRPGAIMDGQLAKFERVWERAEPLAHATDEETEVLDLLCRGMSRDQIRNRLNVSRRTLDRRIEGLRARTNAQSDVQLGVRAVMHGLIPTG